MAHNETSPFSVLKNTFVGDTKGCSKYHLMILIKSGNNPVLTPRQRLGEKKTLHSPELLLIPLKYHILI